MMSSSVPHRCVFCHSADPVVPATRIWHGAVVRSWRCETCERVWPLRPDGQWTIDRRRGEGARRKGDPCPFPLFPRCHSAKTAITLKTAYGRYCRCSACGHVWHAEERRTPPE